MKDKIRLEVMKVFNQEADVDTVVNNILLLLNPNNTSDMNKDIIDYKIIGKNIHGVIVLNKIFNVSCKICKYNKDCRKIPCSISDDYYYLPEEEEQKLELTIIPDITTTPYI